MVSRSLFAASLVLCSCSLGNISQDDCTEDTQCAEAFGEGSVCRAGFCAEPPAEAPLDERCIVIGSEEEDAVEFGAIMPRSNADLTAHKWGPYWESSIELAIEQLNPPFRTGINGKPVRVVSCDTRSDVAQASELATYLVERKVPAIISDGSGETIAISAITIPAGVLLLAGASTAPEVTDIPDRSPDGSIGLVWRTTPSDSYQADVLAARVLADSAPSAPLRVAVLARDDSYGQGLLTAFGNAYEGESEGFVFPPVVAGEPDATGKALQAAAAFAPEAIMIVGFPDDIVAVLNGADAHPKLDGVAWYFTQGAKFPELFDKVKDLEKIDGAIGTALAQGDPETSEAFKWFGPQFKSKYGDYVASVADLANMFDAAILIGIAGQYASNESQVLDGTHMARAFTHMNDKSGKKVPLDPPHYNIANSELQAGHDINIDGASGPLDFDIKTGEAQAAIEVWTISVDEFEIVEVVAPP